MADELRRFRAETTRRFVSMIVCMQYQLMLLLLHLLLLLLQVFLSAAAY
jgi:hypothetical protein